MNEVNDVTSSGQSALLESEQTNMYFLPYYSILKSIAFDNTLVISVHYHVRRSKAQS